MPGKIYLCFRSGNGIFQKNEKSLIAISTDLADIFYAPEPEDNFCRYHKGKLNLSYTKIECNTLIAGQFVKKNTTYYLNLYEVEVCSM